MVGLLSIVRKQTLGARGVQSAKRPTLGFGSGHDLTVREFKPHIGLCADSAESAWDSLSPPLPHLLPTKINK